jgi:hypothetical protein
MVLSFLCWWSSLPLGLLQVGFLHVVFVDGVCETAVFIYTFTVPSTVLKTRLSIELMAKISL